MNRTLLRRDESHLLRRDESRLYENYSNSIIIDVFDVNTYGFDKSIFC